MIIRLETRKGIFDGNLGNALEWLQAMQPAIALLVVPCRVGHVETTFDITESVKQAWMTCWTELVEVTYELGEYNNDERMPDPSYVASVAAKLLQLADADAYLPPLHRRLPLDLEDAIRYAGHAIFEDRAKLLSSAPSDEF